MSETPRPLHAIQADASDDRVEETARDKVAGRPLQTVNPVDVLYILGPGHCGSTILNLCLDRHPEVIGVSEIVTLNRRRPGWSGDEDALGHPFWARVDAELRRHASYGLAEVPFNLMTVSSEGVASALEQNHAALRSIARVAGKRIVADASKDPERLAALLSSPLFRVQVIYLVRDGRAVVHAYRRKYGMWWRGYRKLMRIERVARALADPHDPTACMTVRYEDMATDLGSALRRVCDFAGIGFEPAMLSPDTSSFNGLGGNRLRKRPVERIAVDASWTTEMPRLVKAFTQLAVRGFNRRHGYGD